jgi:hypothetical protein
MEPFCKPPATYPNLKTSPLRLGYACRNAKLIGVSRLVQDSAPLPATLSELPHLRHLAIDTHTVPIVNGLPNTSSPPLWPAMIAFTKSWGSPLASITLRLSDKCSVAHPFIEDLLAAHSSTLEHIAIINVDVAWESVRAIAVKCTRLDRLAFHIPSKDVVSPRLASLLCRHLIQFVSSAPSLQC